MTVIINGTDNSASTPAVTGTDGDTGMFYPAANTVALSTGGSERMRVNSSGNVGIGTTSPGAKLQVTTGGSNSPGSNLSGNIGQFTSSGGIAYVTMGNGDSANQHRYVGAASAIQVFGKVTDAGVATEQMRIDSDGNVGIGTSSPSNLLDIAKSSGQLTVNASTSLSGIQSCRYSAGANSRSMQIGVIKHNGITNNCAFIYLQEEDGGDSFFWTDNSGNFRISSDFNNIGTTNGTVVGTQTSDERLKDILGPVGYGLNEILAIEPIAFTMKDDPSIQKVGFSAQQVQTIVPEAVYDTRECIDGYTKDEETGETTPNSDRMKLVMEYTQLIPVLVNAIKELSAQVTALQAEVNALKGAE